MPFEEHAHSTPSEKERVSSKGERNSPQSAWLSVDDLEVLTNGRDDLEPALGRVKESGRAYVALLHAFQSGELEPDAFQAKQHKAHTELVEAVNTLRNLADKHGVVINDEELPRDRLHIAGWAVRVFGDEDGGAQIKKAA